MVNITKMAVHVKVKKSNGLWSSVTDHNMNPGVLRPQGGHSNTFMCCHPQASNYRSTPKHRYLEYEIMTPYHRYSFTDLLQ